LTIASEERTASIFRAKDKQSTSKKQAKNSLAACSPRLRFSPENGDSTFLENVSELLPD
jgi:hypothetical protein